MQNETNRTQAGMNRLPAIYRIVVKGRLGEQWSERLAGMRITPGDEGDPDSGRTVLIGPIRDRAELSGVLNTLYELRLSLLSVEVSDDDERKEDR